MHIIICVYIWGETVLLLGFLRKLFNLVCSVSILEF